MPTSSKSFIATKMRVTCAARARCDMRSARTRGVLLSIHADFQKCTSRKLCKKLHFYETVVLWNSHFSCICICGTLARCFWKTTLLQKSVSFWRRSCLWYSFIKVYFWSHVTWKFISRFFKSVLFQRFLVCKRRPLILEGKIRNIQWTDCQLWM